MRGQEKEKEPMRLGARHTRWKEYDAIEDEFFELNHEEKAAVLRLEFE